MARSGCTILFASVKVREPARLQDILKNKQLAIYDPKTDPVFLLKIIFNIKTS